ncbi:MAG: YqgE/AlgH family protein [Bacteroidia bacterium]|nr:YqgE/AlgH family protein [Bacteroidia bacterium]MDW8134274.1 YqgE/AlgH family protein [Bacteroidia bacterium]
MQLTGGILLIAEPYLPDPNFFRTVVLLVEHGAAGSLGFILNRPASVKLKEVTDYFGEVDYRLFRGGPVGLNTLHVLHSIETLPESQKVANGIFWSLNLRSLRALLATRNVPESFIRFFAGYAGWAPGQLESEIAQKAWILTTARCEYVFTTEPEILWQRVLIDMGGKYASLASLPEDPRVN